MSEVKRSAEKAVSTSSKSPKSSTSVRRTISAVGVVVIGFALVVAIREPNVDRKMLVGMIGFFLASVFMFVSSFFQRPEVPIQPPVPTRGNGT